MNNELSIRNQKKAGTYTRNQKIKKALIKDGKEPKRGQISAMGRKYGISRQRIHHILYRHGKHAYLETAQNKKLGGFLHWLKRFYYQIRGQ